MQVGSWAPWVGVALVGIGYMLFTSAPPGSLLFLWIALFASYAAQTLGAALLDPALSGFVGGLVIVPLTYALARFRRSPPAAVMLLPAFWLLLPGALGFRGRVQPGHRGGRRRSGPGAHRDLHLRGRPRGAGRHVGDQGRQRRAPDLEDPLSPVVGRSRWVDVRPGRVTSVCAADGRMGATAN